MSAAQGGGIPLTRWLCAAVFALAGSAQAQTIAVPPSASKPDMATLHYDLRPRQIAEGTWVIEGAVQDFSRANGCNIINTAFIATGAGVVVINTGPSRLYGEQQRRAIEGLTREPVQRVLEAFAQTQKGLIIPTYQGKRGHPIVLSGKYRQEVLALDRQQGLNLVTRGHPEDTLEIPLTDDRILQDMDYPEEYEAILQQWQQRTHSSEPTP